MVKKNGENKYNTNLASEFYVLSSLARLGIDACLSLGNKKKVDIAIMKKNGTYLTIDVKGVAGTDDWILGNGAIDFSSKNHFYILASYEKKISDLKSIPLTWIFSTIELKEKNLVKTASNGKTKYVSHATIRNNFKKFKGRWDIFQDKCHHTELI